MDCYNDEKNLREEKNLISKKANILITLIIFTVLILTSCSAQTIKNSEKDVQTNTQENIQEQPPQEKEIVKQVKATCPKGIHDEGYPGTCYFYDDQDSNGLCDLSE